MQIDYLQKLEIECTNPSGVNPSEINPLIKEFREKLKGLRLQDEYQDLKGRINILDEFRYEQISPNLVMLYWDICKWNLIDYASERVHAQARQRATKMVMDMKFEKNGTTMKVINVIGN